MRSEDPEALTAQPEKPAALFLYVPHFSQKYRKPQSPPVDTDGDRSRLPHRPIPPADLPERITACIIAAGSNQILYAALPCPEGPAASCVL